MGIKEYFQELSRGGGAQASIRLHVRRYFASEGAREEARREGEAGDGRKDFSGQFFFLPLDSPGRAEQTHTRRSKCVRVCRIISAQPAGERSVTELVTAEQKVLNDSALCQLCLPTFTVMLHKQKHLRYRDILI